MGRDVCEYDSMSSCFQECEPCGPTLNETSACKACGDCCQEVPLSMPLDADKALWFGLRGWQVNQLSSERMEVVAPAVCRCYHAGAENGHHCRIYERRPQFCRDYLCPEAKETSP